MSGISGYYQYSCKFHYSHNCNNMIFVNGTSCLDCIMKGRDKKPPQPETDRRPVPALFLDTHEEPFLTPTYPLGCDMNGKGMIVQGNSRRSFQNQDSNTSVLDRSLTSPYIGRRQPRSNFTIPDASADTRWMPLNNTLFMRTPYVSGGDVMAPGLTIPNMGAENHWRTSNAIHTGGTPFLRGDPTLIAKPQTSWVNQYINTRAKPPFNLYPDARQWTALHSFKCANWSEGGCSRWVIYNDVLCSECEKIPKSDPAIPDMSIKRISGPQVAHQIIDIPDHTCGVTLTPKPHTPMFNSHRINQTHILNSSRTTSPSRTTLDKVFCAGWVETGCPHWVSEKNIFCIECEQRLKNQGSAVPKRSAEKILTPNIANQGVGTQKTTGGVMAAQNPTKSFPTRHRAIRNLVCTPLSSPERTSANCVECAMKLELGCINWVPKRNMFCFECYGKSRSSDFATPEILNGTLSKPNIKRQDTETLGVAG